MPAGRRLRLPALGAVVQAWPGAGLGLGAGHSTDRLDGGEQLAAVAPGLLGGPAAIEPVFRHRREHGLDIGWNHVAAAFEQGPGLGRGHQGTAGPGRERRARGQAPLATGGQQVEQLVEQGRLAGHPAGLLLERLQLLGFDHGP